MCTCLPACVCSFKLMPTVRAFFLWACVKWECRYTAMLRHGFWLWCSAVWILWYLSPCLHRTLHLNVMHNRRFVIWKRIRGRTSSSPWCGQQHSSCKAGPECSPVPPPLQASAQLLADPLGTCCNKAMEKLMHRPWETTLFGKGVGMVGWGVKERRVGEGLVGCCSGVWTWRQSMD